MKPLVKYRGGKSKEIPQIVQHIPVFEGRYIEPFFGGGALFFHLEMRNAVINDINPKLMAFYFGVKDDYPRLRRELDEIGQLYADNRADFEVQKTRASGGYVEDKNERLYYKIRDMYNGLTEKQFSDALIYFFINKTAYSGMIRYNAKGEFNVPYGRYRHFNTNLVTWQHHELLRTATVLNEDYTAVFDKVKSDDFMFLDPPYDCVFSDYGNDEYKNGFGDDAHEKLCGDFKNLPCKTLLVIGRTPLTEKLYGGMIVDEYEKSYAVNIRNRFKSAARHILVANYKS